MTANPPASAPRILLQSVRADNASIAPLNELELRFERAIARPDGTCDLQLFSIASA